MEYNTKKNIEIKPKWKECVDSTSKKFPLVIGSLYVRRFFDENTKKTVSEMVNGIREELYKLLESSDWMDEKTRYFLIWFIWECNSKNEIFCMIPWLQGKCDR